MHGRRRYGTAKANNVLYFQYVASNGNGKMDSPLPNFNWEECTCLTVISHNKEDWAALSPTF